MEKKEFILGLCIIALCITAWTIIDRPAIESTATVEIRRVYTVEANTNEEGNVKVEVK
jgi:hypothetical protein